MRQRNQNNLSAPQSRQQRLAGAARWLRRPRVKAHRAGLSFANHAIGSFGMIIGLMMLWAIAASM